MTRYFRYIISVIVLIIVFAVLKGYAKLLFPITGGSTLHFERRWQTQFGKLDCPIISLDNVTIKPAICDNSNGSITGITVTATGNKVQYNWMDFNNKVVGNGLDLINVPAGVYTLEVIDIGNCANPVLSPAITVEAKGALNIAGNPIITESGCSNEGAISGLQVTGANHYQWHCFDTGQVYDSGTTPDIFNIPPGTYRLLISNAICSMQSAAYVVPSKLDIPTITKVEIANATCNNIAVDMIKISLSRHINSPKTGFIFYDSNNLPVYKSFLPAGLQSVDVVFANQPPGTYKFAVANTDFSCPFIMGSYTIKEAKLQIYPDSSFVQNDQCNQHIGFINPYLSGQTPPKPLSTFIWTNAAGEVVGRTKSLIRVGAGKYHLDATDALGCPAKADFEITNSSPGIIPPSVDGSTICLPGQITMFVKDQDTSSSYKLYASLTDTIPLAISKIGFFARYINETTDFYVSRVHVDCESERVKVKEVVVASIKIPTAFTPNNDGINDTWNITGIEKFPNTEIKIYNRNGQQVFYSLDNNAAFNGRYDNKVLPTGVYYYTIDVKQPVCFGKIAGSLTLIR